MGTSLGLSVPLSRLSDAPISGTVGLYVFAFTFIASPNIYNPLAIALAITGPPITTTVRGRHS